MEHIYAERYSRRGLPMVKERLNESEMRVRYNTKLPTTRNDIVAYLVSL